MFSPRSIQSHPEKIILVLFSKISNVVLFLGLSWFRFLSSNFASLPFMYLVEALRYKPEGREFESWWCHGNFPFNIILPVALWPWVLFSLWEKWVPGIFSWGKDGRCIGLTTLPPSYTECLEIWNTNFMEISGPVLACNGIALHFTMYLLISC
jgi:hypothetical protein